MSSHHDHSGHRGAPGPAASGTIRRWKWVFGGFAALAALLLAFEHRMHLSGLIGWLPWLILLACPYLFGRTLAAQVSLSGFAKHYLA